MGTQKTKYSTNHLESIPLHSERQSRIKKRNINLILSFRSQNTKIKEMVEK